MPTLNYYYAATGQMTKTRYTDAAMGLARAGDLDSLKLAGRHS